jgi:hypothetical protein
MTARYQDASDVRPVTPGLAIPGFQTLVRPSWSRTLTAPNNDPKVVVAMAAFFVGPLHGAQAPWGNVMHPDERTTYER